MVKLLVPHGSLDSNEVKTLAHIAMEYRQRVNDWLHVLEPGEFPKKKIDIYLERFLM